MLCGSSSLRPKGGVKPCSTGAKQRPFGVSRPFSFGSMPFVHSRHVSYGYTQSMIRSAIHWMEQLISTNSFRLRRLLSQRQPKRLANDQSGPDFSLRRRPVTVPKHSFPRDHKSLIRTRQPTQHPGLIASPHQAAGPAQSLEAACPGTRPAALLPAEACRGSRGSQAADHRRGLAAGTGCLPAVGTAGRPVRPGAGSAGRPGAYRLLRVAGRGTAGRRGRPGAVVRRVRLALREIFVSDLRGQLLSGQSRTWYHAAWRRWETGQTARREVERHRRGERAAGAGLVLREHGVRVGLALGGVGVGDGVNN
jgi:hypothetical protein